MMTAELGHSWLARDAICSVLTDFKTALECLEAVSTDYWKHSRFARSLVEKHFDAKNVIKHLLERALLEVFWRD